MELHLLSFPYSNRLYLEIINLFFFFSKLKIKKYELLSLSFMYQLRKDMKEKKKRRLGLESADDGVSETLDSTDPTRR